MLRGKIRTSVVLVLVIAVINPKIETQATTSLSICQIQGDGFSSPHIGTSIRTQGVVIADFDTTSDKGFFLQDENCDGDSSTSDGIYVYLGERVNVVSAGDLVVVSGTVQEYYGLTEVVSSSGDVAVLSSGNPLPAATDLDPPFDNNLAQGYFESIEGMYVSLEETSVVGPTNKRDETWVVRTDLGIDRVFRDDPAGTGEIICVDEDGFYEIAPEAKVGDHIQGLVGVLDYSYGTYRLQLLAEPTLIPAGSSSNFAAESLTPTFTFGTFNLENLFDRLDDPAKDDPIPSQAEYQRKLEKLALTLHDELGEPAFIAVQEVENTAVLTDLAARAEIVADYGFVLVEGLDVRGIDVALLYRTDQASVTAYQQRQGCTTLVDGLGPDGNRDMGNPQNDVTCDSDGDGVDDGNRLFSRPPLVVALLVNVGHGRDLSFFVIVNHWKSKGQDTNSQEYTLPRRVEQAQFVADLAQEILVANPEANLVVLGDLNDYIDSQPLQILTSAGLTDLMPLVEKPQRYTYIYRGVSQVLDHVLVSPALQATWLEATPIHVNADYPYYYHGQSGTPIWGSDHEPILVGFTPLDEYLYFPLIIR